MIDAGSTTLETARFLALAETRVTAITNSIQVALMLGQRANASASIGTSSGSICGSRHGPPT